MPTPRARPRAIGITALLSLAIAGLVLLSAGLVLALSSQTAWRSTIDLLRDQAELAMALVEEEVRNHVNPALEISSYLQTQIATGQIRPENHAELVAAFRGALAAAPQIVGVVLWDENFTQLEIIRVANDAVSVSVRQPEITPQLREMIDATRRHDGPRWGPPNEGDEEANYVYTLTSLTHEGKYWGVLATGVTIGNLSSIVRRIGDRLGMTAFILYEDSVLAHPAIDDSTPVLASDQRPRLPTIAELDDPIIAQFRHSEIINQPERDGVEIREIIDATTDRHYVALSKRNSEFGDIPWIIGIYGPAETLGKHLRRLMGSILAGILVLALAILCALWIARKISRPIRTLADSAEQIGMLELAQVGGIARSGIKELDEQAHAFKRMVDGLCWFERYVPKGLVRRLIHESGSDGDASIISREANLSVMFTDIIGFTALSEVMPPSAVAAMLNAHFEIVARCIEAEGGTLDKYIGDSVLAFWGAPEDQPDHAHRACRAALAIAEEIAAAQAKADSGGTPSIRIKIAIHSGPLLVGNIGASSRMNYTVIGDTVNTCSRIESLGARFDNGTAAIILVSADTVRLVQADAMFRFESVGGHAVKGRSGEVQVSRLEPGEDPTNSG